MHFNRMFSSYFIAHLFVYLLLLMCNHQCMTLRDEFTRCRGRTCSQWYVIKPKLVLNSNENKKAKLEIPREWGKCNIRFCESLIFKFVCIHFLGKRDFPLFFERNEVIVTFSKLKDRNCSFWLILSCAVFFLFLSLKDRTILFQEYVTKRHFVLSEGLEMLKRVLNLENNASF